MAWERDSLIDLATTPYYHVISRGVRRAYLCGDDRFTGNNINHRRQWLIDQVKRIYRVFSIETAAYTIMINPNNKIICLLII